MERIGRRMERMQRIGRRMEKKGRRMERIGKRILRIWRRMIRIGRTGCRRWGGEKDGENIEKGDFFYIHKAFFPKNLNMFIKFLMVHKQFVLKSLILLRLRLLVLFF